MQDFNYLSSNDFEVTMELGCQKYPLEKDLEKEWNDNKDALLNFMWQVSNIGTENNLYYQIIMLFSLNFGLKAPVPRHAD